MREIGAHFLNFKHIFFHFSVLDFFFFVVGGYFSLKFLVKKYETAPGFVGGLN